MLLSSERGEWAWPGAVDGKSTLCMHHMWTQGQHVVKGGRMGVLTAWITPMVTILPHCTALYSCFCRKERGQAITGSRISCPELSGRDFNQMPGFDYIFIPWFYHCTFFFWVLFILLYYCIFLCWMVPYFFVGSLHQFFYCRQWE